MLMRKEREHMSAILFTRATKSTHGFLSMPGVCGCLMLLAWSLDEAKLC